MLRWWLPWLLGLALVLPGLTLENSCSEHCKACGGPERDQCLQCQPGFSLHDNMCVDIDECGTELDTCPSDMYCFNTHSSYECRSCDRACVGCMGGGPARCKKCAPGYTWSGVKCVDVDECSEEVLVCVSDVDECSEEGLVCVSDVDECSEEVLVCVSDVDECSEEVLVCSVFQMLMSAVRRCWSVFQMLMSAVRRCWSVFQMLMSAVRRCWSVLCFRC
ncbi:protein disulfide isomerase CRELD1 isoform X2 [Colossoma macropomum]|uniref:protein disulfide isomerase CRELD1 isoform X2 n=1 Tax=Colossoma macropomum TaxID=42526 RepID=UPI0018640399|nr:protein disulfide isomerase CRELD1 isoform X2 [Colossoma macropomum]